MLMAHSVEGRFPFLDPELVELANSLPPSYKLRGLSEKHVVKIAATGLVPEAIINRPKQPYRAPDALSFVGAEAPDWVAELMSERVVAEAGVFDPSLVGRLWRKVQGFPTGEQFSNADNMALVGVLSTGLLHERLVRPAPAKAATIDFKTVVDRLASGDAADAPGRRTQDILTT
jgi:asparagine synthase (glutamine-hydrolysing)